MPGWVKIRGILTMDLVVVGHVPYVRDASRAFRDEHSSVPVVLCRSMRRGQGASGLQCRTSFTWREGRAGEDSRGRLADARNREYLAKGSRSSPRAGRTLAGGKETLTRRSRRDRTARPFDDLAYTNEISCLQDETFGLFKFVWADLTTEDPMAAERRWKCVRVRRVGRRLVLPYPHTYPSRAPRNITFTGSSEPTCYMRPY